MTISLLRPVGWAGTDKQLREANDTDYLILPTTAIAEGAATPNPGSTGARVMGATGVMMRWTGSLWTAAGTTDLKPSGLTALTGANLALGDLAMIADVSATLTKSMTAAQYARGWRQLWMNSSTARVINAAGSTDTYLTGSFIPFPITPEAGMRYKCRFDSTKTNAGTSAIVLTVRVGTAGSTADTSRVVFTMGAGTAVVDTGIFDLEVVFRAVGSGTSAVLVGNVMLTHDAAYATGLSNAVNARVTVSSGFDSTASPGTLGIGVSYNGGTTTANAVHTVEQVTSEIIP